MSNILLNIGPGGRGLTIGSFYGGVERGPCLQFTIAENFVQLTISDVERIAAELHKWRVEVYEQRRPSKKVRL